jgi:predicted Zn-dependent peptidase
VNHVLLSIFLLGLASFASAEEESPSHLDDPYSQIEFFVLENGLEVILAPESAARTVKVYYEVDVGYGSEDVGNLGVSHLLEHTLFRHPDLSSNMSFLDVIQEKGGQGNGVTSKLTTSYFATVPSKKVIWTIQTFAKMMLGRKIQRKDLEKSRREVQLEIGEANPVSSFLGFDAAKWLTLPYLKAPEFYEYNFGMDLGKTSFTEEENRLSNQKIRLDQVQDRYDRYYYPGNSRLYVAGTFEPTKIKEVLRNSWGSFSSSFKHELRPVQTPKPRGKPQVIHDITSDNVPSLQVGTLLYDLTYLEEVAVNIYINFMASELMKEIRNQRGQTYTVVPRYYTESGVGFASVELEAHRADYGDIESRVRSVFMSIAEGGLSGAEFESARAAYLKQLSLVESDSESLYSLSAAWRELRNRYGRDIISPYAMARDLTTEQMNEALKKHFQPQRRLEILNSANILFRYDDWVFGFLIFLIGLAAMRWITLKPFNHSEVRWVRKVRYPGLKLVELSALALSAFMFDHAKYVLEQIIPELVDLRQVMIFNGYLLPWTESLTVVVILIATFSAYPRKLMVVNHSLLVKSLTFYSYRIAFEDIEGVEATLYLKHIMSWKNLRELGWRHYIFHPFVWEPALLVRTKQKSYVFSIKEGNEAAGELRELIGEFRKTNLFENKSILFPLPQMKLR